jgi:hypothetical protein
MLTFHVIADYHQFYWLDEMKAPQYPEDITDAELQSRVKTVPFLIAVYTSSDGRVEVQVERTSTAPPRNIDAWSHVFSCPPQRRIDGLPCIGALIDICSVEK